MEKRRILITGSEGYLARSLISRFKTNPCVEKIYGLDIREHSTQEDEIYEYIRMSVTDLNLPTALEGKNIDTAIHAAWTFDPTHDEKAQWELDIHGTANLLSCMTLNKIKNLVYIGSTTAYGALRENPLEEPFLREEDWKTHSEKRVKEKYLYGRHKALVDAKMQRFQKVHLGKNIFWMRGAIVLGPDTNNIVSHIVESPFTFGRFMFRVAGYDPPMQFVSEYDMTEVLYLATMNKWSGVVNLAGDGIIQYSNLIKIMGRHELCLPGCILRSAVWALWKLRLFKFPPSLLRLIQYPWVADTTQLKEKYGYQPLFSSRDALDQFANRYRK